jgi:hypothetical protein
METAQKPSLSLLYVDEIIVSLCVTIPGRETRMCVTLSQLGMWNRGVKDSSVSEDLVNFQDLRIGRFT